MVIVNALPKFGVICAAFVSLDLGAVTDEIQIELDSCRGRHIVLESGKSVLDGYSLSHIASGILTIAGLKASDALGTPRFEHNWRDSAAAIKRLNLSFSYHVDKAFIEQSAAMASMVVQCCDAFAIDKPGLDASALLGSNTHWFTDGNIVTIG